MRTILLRATITPDELVEELVGIDNEVLIQIIKDIDKSCACYDFTQELRDYFVKEMVKEEHERSP